MWIAELQAETLQKLSPCDVQALKKCLDENKGDHKKVCGAWHAGLRAEGKHAGLAQAGGAAGPNWAATTSAQPRRLPACPASQCLEEVQAFQQACSKAKPAAQASAETFASK